MEYGAVVVWWFLLVALGIAGVPIAAAACARLPDRGAGVALPAAMVVLAVPTYWIGHLAFGLPAIAAGVLVLVAGSATLAWRGTPTRADRFVEVAVVFTAAFGLVVAIRAVDPSIHTAGGEKFLDFGLLNALLRTDRLPPEDMWFAGEPVKYYYGGHLLAAILATLSGTAPRYAYNLALAGFYGTLVASAYGVAGSIAAARGGPYRLAGLAGAFFVGFASNLVAALQAVLWFLPAAAARPIADAVASVTALETDALVSPGGLFYWTSSRVIRGTINEFPLFAWLNGDLHAHMMSTPFLVLVVALAFAYYRTPPDAIRRRRALVFGAVPPVAGLVAVVNTWSFPSTAGLTWLALVFAPTDPGDLLPAELAGLSGRGATGYRAEGARVGAATIGAIGVGLLGVLWALPFFVGPATGARGRSIGAFPEPSGFVEFLLVHGWVLIVFGLYLGVRALPLVDRRGQAALLAAVVAFVGLFTGAAAVTLVLPVLVIAWILLRRDADVGFETVLFVAGAGLVLVVEVVFVQEQAGPGRMNTVFKTYMQVWVLWAVGTGAALARLASDRVEPPSDGTRRTAVTVVAVALVASLSIYGAVALGGHFAGASEPTLDATRWARGAHPEEWEAIQFLDRQAGQPNIVTAPGCWCHPVPDARPYTWVNAPSSFTGVPTLAGWSHEEGYRGREVYRERVADVETIYTGSWDRRATLLARYDVRYVYVGPTERDLYGSIDFGDRVGEGRALTVAFENDAVTVYEVHPDRLRSAGAGG